MKNFLYKIYLYSFLDDFMLVYPIYTLLFKADGLTTFQISTLLALWAFTSLILEIPTGVLADKFSRKNILIISQVIRIAGYASWLFFHSYAGFLAGFILWGINGALKSGTFEALVYDELKFLKAEDSYEKILSRLKIFSFIGLSLALALGGIFANINFNIPIILSIAVLFAAAINLLTFKQVGAVRSTKEKRYLEFLKNALSESWNNKTLLELILLFAFVFGIYGAFDEYLSLIFKNYGISLSLIGIFVSINYVLYAAGTTLSGVVKLKSNIVIFVMALISGAAFFITGMFQDAKPLIILIFLAALLLGFIEIKVVSGVQKLINSNSRATIISIKVFLQEVIAILFILTIGQAADKWGIGSALLLAGVLIYAIAIVFIFLHLLPARKR